MSAFVKRTSSMNAKQEVVKKGPNCIARLSIAPPKASSPHYFLPNHPQWENESLWEAPKEPFNAPNPPPQKRSPTWESMNFFQQCIFKEQHASSKWWSQKVWLGRCGKSIYLHYNKSIINFKNMIYFLLFKELNSLGIDITNMQKYQIKSTTFQKYWLKKIDFTNIYISREL